MGTWSLVKNWKWSPLYVSETDFSLFSGKKYNLHHHKSQYRVVQKIQSPPQISSIGPLGLLKVYGHMVFSKKLEMVTS